jgi:hypothetical protein
MAQEYVCSRNTESQSAHCPRHTGAGYAAHSPRVSSRTQQRQRHPDHRLSATGRGHGLRREAARGWRIGTEHEKFGFRLDDLRPPTFDGERGIEALLKG